MLASIRAWLNDRAGVDLQGEPRGLPKGVGWPHTLGIVAVALLLIVAVTGFALSMYYAPHPDAAYESVRYIKQLPMGAVVHGLHHWGASALIVVLGLHLLRCYIQGAYKAPRELIWLSGLVLITLVIGFGVTGELPSHPELLDWLAVDFRENGWAIKRFFRQLVTSATYRQSAAVTPEKLEKDPQNRLLSRGPRFRMDAEMVRDGIEYATEADKRRLLEVLGMRINIKHGHYYVQCLLGEWNGKVVYRKRGRPSKNSAIEYGISWGTVR